MCYKVEQIVEYDSCYLKPRPPVWNHAVTEPGPASAETTDAGLPLRWWLFSRLRSFNLAQPDPSPGISAADAGWATGATATGAPNDPDLAPMNLPPHSVTWISYMPCGKADEANLKKQVDEGLEGIWDEKNELKFVCRVPKSLWPEQLREENMQREVSHMRTHKCPVCKKMEAAEKEAQTVFLVVCNVPPKPSSSQHRA